MAEITLRDLQKHIREKDHHPELKLQYFQKLVEETGELAKAMRKDLRYEDTISKTTFLITGKPRMGKSTTVKRLVNYFGTDICGGFYTEEITHLNNRVGFRCVSADGESVEIASVESPSQIRVGRYGVEIDKFERFAVKVLENALSCPKQVIVIDEIGFMQMLSTPFQHIVQDIISRGHIVLGTVPVASHPEIDQIKYQKAVKIIHLNESNRDVTWQLVAQDVLRALIL